MSSRVMPTRGMRDFLPSDKFKREKVLDILRHTYVSLGFQEIETPAMEPITRLKSGQGGENESMIFEVMRRGLDPQTPLPPAEAVDLGMRYDLTMPLSRYYATHMAELPAVFRAFQTGPVWRAERPQKGRFRQFNQVDIDLLGSDSYLCEVEVLATGWMAAKRLGLAEQCTILINHRQFLNDLLRHCGIAEQCAGAALIELDKMAKIGPEKVAQQLVDREIATDQQAQQLLQVVQQLSQLSQSASGQQMEAALAQLQLGAADTELSLYQLPQIIQALQTLHPDLRIKFDPTLVRGMGYYTGPIFEIVHEQAGSSICGGGRYDGVIGRWSNKQVPAVGLSFGFERIIDLVQLDQQAEKAALALAYQKEPEALVALQLRDRLDALARQGRIDLERVGLVKASRKINATFFAGVKASGYRQILLPSAYLPAAQGSDEQLIALFAGAKTLG